MSKNLYSFKKIAAVFLSIAILLGILCIPNSVPVSAVAGDIVYNGDAEQSDTEALGWAMISMENTNQSSEAAGKTNRYDKEFTLSAVPGEGVDGTNALKAAKKSSYGYAAMVSNPVAITAGTDYLLSYSYKMTDLTVSAAAGYALAIRVLVEQLDANGNCLITTKQGSLIGNSAGKITEDIQQWQNVSTGFTAAEGAATCRIYFFMGGMSAKVGFNAWYDNISMVAQEADQLDNGEFEAVLYKANDTGADYKLPRPAFWNSITTRDTGVPRTDINSLPYYGMVQVNEGAGHETAAKLYVTNASGGFGGVTYYSDPVSVYAGEEYEVKYDLKISGVLPEDVSNSYGAIVWARYLDANGNYIGNPSRISTVTKNNQDWKSYSYKITVPENAARMQIGMMIGVGTRNRNKDMTYYFDHMQLIRMESLKDPAVTSSALYKKNVLFLGDEIGSNLAQYAGGYSEMKVTDHTVTGAGVSAQLAERIGAQTMPAAENFDYVLVSGGLYDAIANVPAGTVDVSTEIVGDVNTYAGGLETLFMSLAEQYDGLKVAYIFPYQTDVELGAYHDVAKAATEKWNIYLLDLYDDDDLDAQDFEQLWKYMIPAVEQVPVLDATKIPGFSAELMLTAKYNSIVGAGVTPATNVEALAALGERVAAEGAFPLLAEKIVADLAVYELYRPEILGATITINDANKLKFIANAPQKELPENVMVCKLGFLIVPYAQLAEGEKIVTSTPNAMNVTAAYTAAGAQYGGYISGMKVDPAVEYAAVAYTLYEVDGKQYVLYSTNNYENAQGVLTAKDGCCVKSVYGIAVEMAMYLTKDQNQSLDWTRLGGQENTTLIATATEKTKPSLQDIFLFNGSNQAILQKMMETEEATNEK